MEALTRFVAAVLIFGWTAFPALADDPDTTKITAEVDKATRAVKFVTYRAEVWVEGAVSIKQPRIQAVVKGMESDGGKLPMLWIDGAVLLPDSDDKHAFQVILNEKFAAAVNPETKNYKIGKIPEAVELVSEPMQTCVMREFLHPTPFSDELEADSRDYEGRQTIGGVECHVIMVTYRGGTKSRWYFGVEDNLPHRVDRIHESSKGMAARVLELHDIDVKTPLNSEVFEIRLPADYTKEEYKAQNTDSNGLLSVGTPAPDWTLKGSGGEAVSLSALRGKVVLLDFWATWCGPCKLIMPRLQKMHEEFKDKPLAIYGVNTWERNDPVAFMKQKQYTYGLLLDGDSVAKQYRVRGIPTIYLIGPDGKILYATTGVSPSHEKELSELIKITLDKMGH